MIVACSTLTEAEGCGEMHGWKYNSQDGLTSLPPEVMHVWATKP